MILITGGTGLTGSAVVREFVRQGHRARALVRRPLPALPGISTVHGDLLAPDTLGPALDGVDTAVLISGADGRMAEAQANLIDAAARCGVRRVVKVSGMGTDPDSSFRFARLHARIEEHLRASGIAWTILRPSQFMQVYLREVPTMLADGELTLPLGATRLAPIDVEDIAKVVYAAATSDGHESAVHEMTGPQALTMAEVAEILTGIVGRPIRYVDLSPEEHHRRVVAAGVPAEFADDVAALFRLRRAGSPESTVDTTVFSELGLRPTSFADFAARAAQLFRGEVTPDRLWASGWQAGSAAR
ncbi:SDR family oxidoreductase [Amycolatopsis sp. NPDC051372]|uniref:SDR family oxidoreductase n=1 Tax=Amycolatopsis sp. NPDC051372 TaxID=3155669 RepID=UPI003430605C